MKNKRRILMLLTLLIIAFATLNYNYATNDRKEKIDSCVKECIGNGGDTGTCGSQCSNKYPATQSSTTDNRTEKIDSCVKECIGNGGDTSTCGSQCSNKYPAPQKPSGEGNELSGGYDPSLLENGYEVDENIQEVGNKIANTIFSLLQIVSFAGIIIAGIKYMYSSSDQRADIKKSIIYIIIGMVLVFAASSVAKFATSTFAEIIK